MTDAVQDAYVLQLREGLTSGALDTWAPEKQFVVALPDGSHFRLTARLQQLLECIDGQRTLAGIAAELSRKWERPVTPGQVWEMAQSYLAANGLLRGSTPPSRDLPERRIFSWHRPFLSARQIAPVTNLGRHFFAAPVAAIGVAVVALAHWAVYTRADVIGLRFAQALGSGEFLAVYGLVLLSVLVHEFGHASACRRFGERYGDIGVALYVIFPVFYADVTRIWRLGRWQRAVVDLGGIYFQLLVAAAYAGLHVLTGHHVWLLAVVQIDLLVLFTLNPIGRFDGYWLLSDMLGVTNLWRELKGMARRLAGRAEDPGFGGLPMGLQACLWVYCITVGGAVAAVVFALAARAPQIAGRFVETVAGNLHAIGAGWTAVEPLAVAAGVVKLIAPAAFMAGGVLWLFRVGQSLSRAVRIAGSKEKRPLIAG